MEANQGRCNGMGFDVGLKSKSYMRAVVGIRNKATTFGEWTSGNGNDEPEVVTSPTSSLLARQRMDISFGVQLDPGRTTCLF